MKFIVIEKVVYRVDQIRKIHLVDAENNMSGVLVVYIDGTKDFQTFSSEEAYKTACSQLIGQLMTVNE